MSSVPVFVGIDYHQRSVQVCVLDGSDWHLANRSVENDAVAVAQVATRHGQPARVAIEACCGAVNLAEELATRSGLPVKLAHPGYLAFMKRLEISSETGLTCVPFHCRSRRSQATEARRL